MNLLTVSKLIIEYEFIIIAILSLIIFGFSLGIILGIIRMITMQQKFKQVKIHLMDGDHASVIDNGKWLLKFYIKNKSNSLKYNNALDYLNIALAVSYFSTSEYDLFLEHINSVKGYDNLKKFWLSLFYLQQNEIETAQTYYDTITNCDDNKTNIAFLDSIILNKQGQIEFSKDKMQSIYSELHYPILKQIADQIINQNF